MTPQQADLVSTVLWSIGIVAILGMAFQVLPRELALWAGISAMVVGGMISGYSAREKRRRRGEVE